MPFSVRLPEEMLAELDKEAKRRAWSRTHVLQACVERALPELAAEAFGNSPGRELKNGKETIIPEVEKGGQEDRSTGVGDGEDTGEAGAAGTPEALINPKMVEVWAEIGANIRREIMVVAEKSLLLPREGKAQDEPFLYGRPTSETPPGTEVHIPIQAHEMYPSTITGELPRWSEARLRELADAEPGGLMACSPELLTEFIEMAKTDSGVAETLTRAGVKLDSEK